MVKKVEQLPEHIIGELLKVKGILHLIYSEWLKKDDGCWLELEGHVADELKILERSDKKGDFDI